LYRHQPRRIARSCPSKGLDVLARFVVRAPWALTVDARAVRRTSGRPSASIAGEALEGPDRWTDPFAVITSAIGGHPAMFTTVGFVAHHGERRRRPPVGFGRAACTLPSERIAPNRDHCARTVGGFLADASSRVRPPIESCSCPSAASPVANP
jgi:hypothetical protein